MTYRAPIKDMLFAMQELAGLDAVAQLPGFEEAGPDTARAVLEECARFNEGVVAPLNRAGDVNPSSFKDGEVTTTPGFKEAFRQFAQGGWQGLHHPAEFGGQGLPKLIHSACIEMVNSANLSFALCPLLSDGAIEALLTAGSPQLQATYIPPLIAGTWTGTMNLTEPQAGSDLALVRTRAEPQPDGSYRIFGTKIFITYGEHDMAENIVHLVLARVAGAPEGVKGISLFVCPKFLVNADGSLGARNDVHCVSIEHKLGIKASPTAVLQYGDHGGAVGYLVGQENRGLEYMFIMMNAARYAVGMQGIAVAERAYQQAVQYARERVQSRPVDGSLPGAGPIIHHPDVRRMLMTMRAYTEGCRAMALVAAGAYDHARHHADADGAGHGPGAADTEGRHRTDEASGGVKIMGVEQLHAVIHHRRNGAAHGPGADQCANRQQNEHGLQACADACHYGFPDVFQSYAVLVADECGNDAAKHQRNLVGAGRRAFAKQVVGSAEQDNEAHNGQQAIHERGFTYRSRGSRLCFFTHV